MSKKAALIITSCAVAITAIAGIAFTYTSNAGSRYTLVSNVIYLNKNSMSKSQIQSFLSSKKSSLATYKDKGINDSKKELASTLIYNAAQAWNISPQVLLATLQKEQSLITNQNPQSWAYRSAMGYGCPDGADCNASYHGFANQVNIAAYQFRYNYEALKGSSSFVDGDGDRHPVGAFACNQTTHFYNKPLLPGNTVTFARNTAFASSKSKTVTIANEATASLLCYTPHVGPYGTTGYSGSDNFVYWFTQWFGSPNASVELGAIKFKERPFVSDKSTASFTIKNITKSTLDIGQLNIIARGADGKNLDFPLSSNVKLAAGKTYTYTNSSTLNGGEGAYAFHVGRYQDGAWRNLTDFGLESDNRSNMKQTISLRPQITKQLEVSPTNATDSDDAHKNQPLTATFTVKNPGRYAVAIDNLVVAGRDPSNSPSDFPSTGSITIKPNKSYTYSKSATPSKDGKHRFWTSSYSSTYGWSNKLVVPESPSIVNNINLPVKDSVTVTSSISMTPSSSPARSGDKITGTFTIKNFGNKTVTVGPIGIAGRDPDNKTFDFHMKKKTLKAGESYTYKSTRTATKPGKYTHWISSNRAGIGWDSSYPENGNTKIGRSTSLNIKDAVTVTSPMNISSSNTSARSGDKITGTFTIKNFGNKTVTVGPIGIAGRDPDNKTFDFHMKKKTLKAGESYTYKSTRTATKPGKYTHWISSNRAGIGWDSSYPANETAAIDRSTAISIKDTVTVTSSINVTPSRMGDKTTGTFTVKNFGSKTVTVGPIGIAGRDPDNKSFDMEFKKFSLKPGASYTYTSSRVTSKHGTHRFWISSNRSGIGWDNTYPMSEVSNIVRSAHVGVN